MNKINNEISSMADLSPAWAMIDLSALVHNLNQVKRLIPSDTKIMAVVKADAYGHGAVCISHVLVENGADLLGVAFLSEAVKLREAGIPIPIVILSGVINFERLSDVLNYDIQVVVYDKELICAIASAASQAGKTVKIHLKIDTGMGRLGVCPEDALEFVRFINDLEGVELVGLASHFARSDDSKDVTLQQFDKLWQTAKIIRQAGFDISCLHIANSGAIINYPSTCLDLVRPGLMLYGAYPHPDLRKKVKLKPVLSLKTKIAFLKKVPAGTPISYGHTYVTDSERLIATIPLGYADGYNRLLSNKGQVLINGQRVPVVGRVCMDLTLLDVTSVPNVNIGTQVTIIGRDGKQEITVDEVADWLGTISYEVMCSIGSRIKRLYMGLSS